MTEQERIEKAMETLINYCKSTDCTECIFAHHIEVECGLHNPSAWKGAKDE